MSQIIPIYIPTYINSAEYAPARVQPRLLFYNGMLDCESYYIESGSTTTGGTAFEQTAFPYFDNYNVVTGSFPTTDSNSLLFYNEEAVYGEVPTDSLYSTYWSEYVNLLYNPRTKLLNASAIIPLADYFKMELNDIVEFRSNYYHLRAINDYNLKNGECSLQLLGPILPAAFPLAKPAIPITPTTTTSTTSTSTTSTSTTSTSTTSTTSTSTSTSTTTTTTAAPTIGVNYLINLPATGSYNYSFTPLYSTLPPANAYVTNPSVNCVINDFTRFVFSESCSLQGPSVPPIKFNAVVGTLTYDAALAPYITASVLSEDNWMCSGFTSVGTGQISSTTCNGGGFTGGNNVDYTAKANSTSLTSGSTWFPEVTVNGYRKPMPTPVNAGGQYEGISQVYKHYWVTINTPGYATQSIWLPNGSYSSVNGVPILSGSKIVTFAINGYNPTFQKNIFGGTQTYEQLGTLALGYNNIVTNTFTASGEFAYRFQNQF